MAAWRHPDMGLANRGLRCPDTCPGSPASWLRGQDRLWDPTHRSHCPQQLCGGPQTPELELEGPIASSSHTEAPTSAVVSLEPGRASCGQENCPKCSWRAKCPGGVSALAVPSSLGPKNKPPDKEVWVPVVWTAQWGGGCLPHSIQPGGRQAGGARGTWPGGLPSE